MKVKSFPAKKDFIYWIIFLILFIVLIITHKYGGDKQVIDYISFAGTLSGLILSVVALIVSFIQGLSSGNITSRLEEASLKINSTTDSLKEINELKEISNGFKISLDELNQNILVQLNENKEALSQLATTVNNSFEEIKLSNPSINNEKSANLSSSVLAYDDKYIENLLLSMPEICIRLLLSTLRAFENSRKFNIKKVQSEKEIDEALHKLGISTDINCRLYFLIGTFNSIYYILLVYRLIEITGKYDNAEIVRIDDRLKKLIMKIANQRALIPN